MLDTHYVVWLATNPGKLNEAERHLLGDERSSLLASVISIWEIRMKWQAEFRKGRAEAFLAPDAALSFAGENGIEVVPLTADDCQTMLWQPLGHTDPHDEMLLVHAQRLGVKLLTRDRALIDHPLAYRFD